MGILGYLTVALSVVWAGSEIIINIKTRARGDSKPRDRSSLVVFRLTTLISIAVSVTLKVRPGIVAGAGKLMLLSPFLGYLGCLLIAAGLIIRWLAISTLRRQFTISVSIVEDHKIIDTGIYASIRHPAYLGSLLSFLGLGLAFESWICLLILVILPLTAVLYRISVEEKVLIDHFGQEYSGYMMRTKRLIPKVF
jgi:protein-S-isoprenylcysteine O-methyltransferase Ste14